MGERRGGRVLAVMLALALAACGDDAAVPDGGPRDAGARDSGPVGMDGGPIGTDSGGLDAGPPDAGPSPELAALEWVLQISGTGTTQARAIAVDSDGNVYVGGSANDEIAIGDGTIAAGAGDAFIAKVSPTGTLIWGRELGGPRGAYVTDLALDSSGALYATGRITGPVDFDGTMLSTTTQLGFLARLSTADGTFDWAAGMGWAASGVAVSDDVFVTGDFGADGAIGGEMLTTNGQSDVFVASYATDGTPRWGRSFGATESDSGFGIALDGSGAVLVGGQFRLTVTVGAFTLTPDGDNGEGFVARYDTDGAVLSAFSWGSSTIDGVNDLVPRGATGLVAAGNFPYGDQIIAFMEDGSQDWAVRFNAIGTYGIARDATGSVYAAGLSNAPIRIGSTEVPTGMDGDADVYLIVIGDDGVPTRIAAATGALREIVHDVARGSDGTYVAGAFPTALTAGTDERTAAGTLDGFVLRLRD